MKYTVYVWKYLDDTGVQKQLINMYENIGKRCINELKKLYDYWNYEIEIKGG